MSTETTPTSPDVAIQGATIAALNWGFRIAAALMAFGVVLSLIRQDPLQEQLPTLDVILDDVVSLRGSGFIGLALFAIVVTPVATSLVIADAFRRAGNHRYMTISLVVLVVLAISIAWSQR